MSENEGKTEINIEKVDKDLLIGLLQSLKLLEDSPITFFRYNILHYCSHDEMMALRDWLNTYDNKTGAEVENT